MEDVQKIDDELLRFGMLFEGIRRGAIDTTNLDDEENNYSRLETIVSLSEYGTAIWESLANSLDHFKMKGEWLGVKE